MPRLSAFTPCGMLSLSAKPSHAQVIYESMVRSLSQSFDMSQGTREEAFAYALAMACARAMYQNDRAANQAHPLSAYDLLPKLEQAYGVAGDTTSNVYKRAAVLAAIDALTGGGRLTDLKSGLRSLLGADFVAVVPLSAFERPLVWPPESIALSVVAPADLYYDAVNDLVWVADSGAGEVYAIDPIGRAGKHLIALAGCSRVTGDGTYVYVSSPATQGRFVWVLDPARGAVVAKLDLGAGFYGQDLASDGTSVYVVARSTTVAMNSTVQAFALSTAIAAYPSTVTATRTSAAGAYYACAWDSVTAQLFVGTRGSTSSPGNEQLLALSSALAVTSSANEPTASYPYIRALLAAGGWVWASTAGANILRITPGAFPNGGSVVACAVSSTQSARLSYASADGRVVVGDDSGGGVISRVNPATPAQVSSFTVPGAGTTSAAALIDGYLWIAEASGSPGLYLFWPVAGAEAQASLLTGTSVSSVSLGPGNWVDPRLPVKRVRLLDPAFPGTSWVGYEQIDTAQIVTLAWGAAQTYALGASVVPRSSATGFFCQCTTAGTSGATEPTWPTQVGATVSDGSCVWTCAATLAPALNVGDTLTVEGDNSATAERVTVLATATGAAPAGANSSAANLFQATFAKAHPPGASAVDGTFPYWWSTQRSLLVVVSQAASVDREKRRKVHDFMQKSARGVDTWAIAAAESNTQTYVLVGGLNAGNQWGASPLGTLQVNL